MQYAVTVQELLLALSLEAKFSILKLVYLQKTNEQTFPTIYSSYGNIVNLFTHESNTFLLEYAIQTSRGKTPNLPFPLRHVDPI